MFGTHSNNQGIL